MYIDPYVLFGVIYVVIALLFVAFAFAVDFFTSPMDKWLVLFMVPIWPATSIVAVAFFCVFKIDEYYNERERRRHQS